MDRIENVVTALYNTEADLAHLLAQCAFPMRILRLDSTQLENLIVSEMAALKLSPIESMSFEAPSSGAFEPISSQVERLKKSLYEVVQALAINALATQTQNARQSAAAKGMDREPLQVLLSSFARPIREAFEHAFDAVAVYRGDDPEAVTLTGFDEYTATMEDLGGAINGQTEKVSIRTGDGSRDAITDSGTGNATAE
jgi:hypothetical protein